MLKLILKNVFTLLFLGIGVYVVTVYWDSIIHAIPTPAKNVLGITISSQQKSIEQKKQEVSKSIEHIVKEQTDTIKNQVLHITVGDILETVGRGQKIANDAQMTGKYITEQVSNFTKNITKK